MQNENTHTLDAWTEIEYSPACKNPYLEFPFLFQVRHLYICVEKTDQERNNL